MPNIWRSHLTCWWTMPSKMKILFMSSCFYKTSFLSNASWQLNEFILALVDISLMSAYCQIIKNKPLWTHFQKYMRSFHKSYLRFHNFQVQPGINFSHSRTLIFAKHCWAALYLNLVLLCSFWNFGFLYSFEYLASIKVLPLIIWKYFSINIFTLF